MFRVMQKACQLLKLAGMLDFSGCQQCCCCANFGIAKILPKIENISDARAVSRCLLLEFRLDHGCSGAMREGRLGGMG